MNNLKTTAALVKLILEQDEKARNCDSHLYMRVLEIVSEDWPVPLYGMTVCRFLQDMNKLGAPSFETVRRTRQKVQAEYPELAATKRVRAARFEKEGEYRAFATDDI